MSTNPLYQRLKELDPNTFEDLCFQLLTARHPTAGVTRVYGAGGDGGVDLFRGDLVNGPAVWQCKFFVNGIRQAQKRQISKSLKDVIRNYQPKLWVLCVPVNLDPNAHAWFQQLRRDHKDKLEIALFQAADLVHQLLHYTPIRDAFFQGAILDGAVLRSQLSGIGEYSDSELEALTTNNVDEYLQRLRIKDGRFEYQITYFPKETERTVLPPRLLASITQGQKRVDVFARDEEALRRDPPKIIFGTVGEATKRLLHALETGTAVEVPVEDVCSAFDFIAALPSEVQLFLEPHVPSKEPIYLNIKFGEGASGVEYENLEFRWKRMGTKEIELETADASLPVKIALALRLGDSPSGKFLFEEKFVGKDVRAVQKFVEAVTLLRQTGRVEIADAVRDRVLFSAVMNTDSLSELNRRFKKVLDEICEIAERFRLRLRMPPAIDKETLESIPILLQLARNGRSQVELSNVTATLSKVTDEERFMAGLQSENAFTFAFEDFVAPARIFGKEIHVGPASIVCSRAIIRNSDEAKQRYLAAKEGGGIPLDFEPLSPSEIVLGRIAHTE